MFNSLSPSCTHSATPNNWASGGLSYFHLLPHPAPPSPSLMASFFCFSVQWQNSAGKGSSLCNSGRGHRRPASELSQGNISQLSAQLGHEGCIIHLFFSCLSHGGLSLSKLGLNLFGHLCPARELTLGLSWSWTTSSR